MGFRLKVNSSSGNVETLNIRNFEKASWRKKQTSCTSSAGKHESLIEKNKKVLSSRVFSLNFANVIYTPEVQPCFIGWRITIFQVNLSPKKNRHVHFFGTGMSQNGEPPQPGYIEIGLNISCRPNQFIWNFCRDGLLVFTIFWFSVWRWHTLHKLERQRWTMWMLWMENLQFVVSIQLWLRAFFSPHKTCGDFDCHGSVKRWNLFHLHEFSGV